MTPKAKTADLLPDDHKPPSPEQLDTMRDAMCAAIEARDVAAIERVFLWAHQILTDAQVLELRYKREKDVESQRRYWEIELGVERLRARWLIDTKKAGLRYDPRRSKVKFGAPTPHLISLDAAGQPPRIGIDRKKSQQLQAFAKLSEKQFKAELADKTMPTVAGIIRRYAKPTTAGHRSPPSPAIVADVDDRPIQINAPDADDEDESLLHSLDTPDLDSLPGISTDELREKRKQAITQMQADRTAMRGRTCVSGASRQERRSQEVGQAPGNHRMEKSSHHRSGTNTRMVAQAASQARSAGASPRPRYLVRTSHP